MDMPPCPQIDAGRKRQQELIVIGESMNESYLDSKRIVGLMRKNASERIQKPHHISDLVIRKEGRKYTLAAFMYFPEEGTYGVVPRPTEWFSIDIISGQPLARYLCSENEFSKQSYDRLYNLIDTRGYDISPEFYRTTYNILDEVRIEFMQTKKLNSKRYLDYVRMIVNNTPLEFQQFYLDLGKIKSL